jgi:rhomboid protease GluP
MDRIEPTFKGTDLIVPDESERTPPRSTRFAIRVGSRLRKVGSELRAASFHSKGEIEFRTHVVVIRTHEEHLLRADVITDVELPRLGICNVEQRGRVIRFEAPNHEGGLELIILKARNRREAADIVAALPDRVTAMFTTAKIARRRFLDAIQRQTPVVWATWTLIAVNALVFIAMAQAGAGVLGNSAIALRFGSNFGIDTMNGQWWRLITATFVHFGFAHVFFNMLVLAQAGRVVERLFGSLRFLAVYLFAGLTGSLMSLLMHPQINSAGASGAIFGVVGALLAYVLRYRSTIPASIYTSHFKTTTVFIVYNLIGGFSHYNVDNSAHVGGLLGGLLIGWLLARPVDANDSAEQRRTQFAIAAVACTVCVLLLAGPMLTLNASQKRQEAMRFNEALIRLSVDEIQAKADLKTMVGPYMKPDPHTTPAELSNRIRSRLLPEWNHLYDTVNDTPLPTDPAMLAQRQTLLHYYDDVRRMLLCIEQAADANALTNPQRIAQIRSYSNDARDQLRALTLGTIRVATENRAEH